MVVARSRGEVEELLPGWATWAYYDVVEERPEALAAAIEARGWKALRYDVRHRQPLPDASLDARELAKTTWLALVDEGGGLWTWQIPLYGGKRLSLGVVSRHGPVSPEQYRAVAEAHAAPHFVLARRGEDGPSPFDRLHTRGGFARRAKVPADRDFILLADAYGFSDPVYSVGAGLAVSQAVEVAQLLNRGGWTRERCEAYVARAEQTLARARAAFEFWYSGAVLSDAAAANEVQDDFLLGGLFHRGISEHYGAAIELASLDSERDPFEADWSQADLAAPLSALLELDADALAGWTLLGARPCAGGLQLRWSGEGHGQPELTMLVAEDPAQAQPCYRRSGPLALSYMQLFERPYPQSPALDALFEALAARLDGRADQLHALAHGEAAHGEAAQGEAGQGEPASATPAE
nr:tryptophan 7-halogenase [Pseudenhygromyxa sp. WMMC2535]